MRRVGVAVLLFFAAIAVGATAQAQGWDTLEKLSSWFLVAYILILVLVGVFGLPALLLYYLVVRSRQKSVAASEAVTEPDRRDVMPSDATEPPGDEPQVLDEVAPKPLVATEDWEPPADNFLRIVDDEADVYFSPQARELYLVGEEISQARYWAEDPSDPEEMPFEFQTPPGWPDPGRAWLPDPGWEPDRRWPAVPADWQVWLRTAPRPRALPRDGYGPKPKWTTYVDDFDESELLSKAVTASGRSELAAEAAELRRQVMLRRDLYEGERTDPTHSSAARSRWHPLEYTYDRALNDAQALAEAAAELSAEEGVSDEELVAAWLRLFEALDELADADDERKAQDEVDLEAALEQELGWAAVEAWRHAGHDPAATTWEAAEKLAADVLRSYGFSDASVTRSGSDSGLDVKGKAIAAQVKYTEKPVGRPAIQQLSGASGGRLTAFFSRAGYSAQAVDEAELLGMALFRITLPSRVTPVNAVAKRMAAR